ncbi:IS30 family transposase [thiotrophic endosymbiont of Bathymodiolus puteoserpentis (Logatchev)]|nr:IS30 family transposase [thiotrophic endosymbiont of Bathymodiolus puteoserpentis (Logatchev)]
MSWKNTQQSSLADALVIEQKSLSELDDVHNIINWNEIEQTLSSLYSSVPGAPAYPPLMMFKILILQAWYNLSDEAKLTDCVKNYISEKLKEYWSPEQIMGRLELDKKIKISTETAYRFVLQDKAVGGALYKYLRHQHKKYRKRYGKNDYRGRIPNRIDIDERPSIVDARTRIGDWEVDLVIGKGHKGGFATLAERKSRLYLALPIVNKTAQNANDAINKRLTPLKHWVKTLTFDNGREFSWHEKLAENLDCNTYFAKPYHSWERGLNENHNGLLRQFFPKRMALDNVSEKEAFRATDLMNNRPRKCLGYKTPFEVFAKMTGKDYFLNGSVALMG